MSLQPVTTAIVFMTSKLWAYQENIWYTTVYTSRKNTWCYVSKLLCTVYGTSDYTLWNLYCSYFNGISASIELQVYSVTYCCPYINKLVRASVAIAISQMRLELWHIKQHSNRQIGFRFSQLVIRSVSSYRALN
jgi:hypothetical protein